MRTGLIFSLALIILSGLTPSIAHAQTTVDISIPANTCLNCHMADANPARAIPPIAGQPEAVLRAQLRAFKSETPPPHTTIMDRLVSGFDDDELTALAQYFSQLPVSSTTAKGAVHP